MKYNGIRVTKSIDHDDVSGKKDKDWPDSLSKCAFLLSEVQGYDEEKDEHGYYKTKETKLTIHFKSKEYIDIIEKFDIFDAIMNNYLSQGIITIKQKNN